MLFKESELTLNSLFWILSGKSNQNTVTFIKGIPSTLTVDFLEKKLHLPPAKHIPINGGHSIIKQKAFEGDISRASICMNFQL